MSEEITKTIEILPHVIAMLLAVLAYTLHEGIAPKMTKVYWRDFIRLIAGLMTLGIVIWLFISH